MKLSVCWRYTHACHDAPMNTMWWHVRTDTNFELVVAFIFRCQPIPQISLKINFHTAIFIRNDIIPSHYTLFFFSKSLFTMVYNVKRHHGDFLKFFQDTKMYICIAKNKKRTWISAYYILSETTKLQYICAQKKV